MVTETKMVQLRILTADEGKLLTNGMVYTKEVVLGCNESESNWTEIPEEEREDES